MMKRILSRKLNNQSGASLMVALLFFVMCAVVGSIVLTSATGVTGQLANLKKNDAEYYAVSSAARYIVDSLKNAEFTVSIERTDNSDSQTTYGSGNPVLKEGDSTDTTSFMYNLISGCFGDKYLNQTQEDCWTNNLNLVNCGKDISVLKVAISIADYDALGMNMDYSMDPYGVFTAIIYRTEDKTKDGYKLEIVAVPTITENTISDGGEEAGVVAESKTTRRTYTISYPSDKIKVRKYIHTGD